MVQTFIALNFFPFNKHFATDSKSELHYLPQISHMASHIEWATQYSKNKWLAVSFSSQNKESIFSNFLLFAKLSLLKILLLAKSHKKIRNMEGIEIFHITGVSTTT
jgi:hypothetical protein